jgi:hypothetical protein
MKEFLRRLSLENRSFSEYTNEQTKKHRFLRPKKKQTRCAKKTVIAMASSRLRSQDISRNLTSHAMVAHPFLVAAMIGQGDHLHRSLMPKLGP